MSGRITLWGASQLLMCYFARTAIPPASFYLALVRDVAPTPWASGLELDEPDVEDYQRVEVANDLLNWANDSQPHEVASMASITFMEAVSDWGMIRYWALCDSPSGGNVLFNGDMENPVLVAAGDQVEIPDGDLSIELGPFFLAEEEE